MSITLYLNYTASCGTQGWQLMNFTDPGKYHTHHMIISKKTQTKISFFYLWMQCNDSKCQSKNHGHNKEEDVKTTVVARRIEPDKQNS